MQNLKYKIYPSLLDAYQYYASSESETAELDLLNKINRVPFTSEAASKGTIFNEFVDLSIAMRKRHKLCYLDGIALQIVEQLQDALAQQYTETLISVDGANVLIYGYYDYLLQDTCIDLKTTKEYFLGKFQKSLQLHFYPVSLIDAGCQINKFEFLVTDFKDVYSEIYDVNYLNSKQILVNSCKDLIRFLEAKKHLITDKKIFALD